MMEVYKGVLLVERSLKQGGNLHQRTSLGLGVFLDPKYKTGNGKRAPHIITKIPRKCHLPKANMTHPFLYHYQNYKRQHGISIVASSIVA
uniref:Uncharacterized protein n=1 Tax=Lactuca sativa TaxID=4236 RepID=A0A9R1VU12_LACSA|nr:hypothetical protein LSAT_V11C400169730 [Lactuca sativa]